MSGRFWIIASYIALVFLLGGSARHDIATLVILRPLAIAAIAYALVVISGVNIRTFSAQIGLFSALIVMVGIQVIPLPPSVWQSLPYREFIAQIDAAVGLDQQWRPISIAPERTWNSLYALLVPMSVVLLVCSLDREERFALLPVIILLGIFSGALGLVQIGAGSQSPLYYYRISNNDSAIGLLANRNHHGVFLATLFPMLAVFASLESRSVDVRRIRTFASIALAAILIPLILVTGSRAGLLFGAVGLASVPFLYSRPTGEVVTRRSGQTKLPLAAIIGGSVGALLLILAGLIFSRAEALDRLIGGAQNDFRWEIWQPSLDLAMRYFPIGSGVGTFVEAFQRDEPFATLAPTYVNHVHNDWLELLLTGGVPAVVLVILAISVWARGTLRAWYTKGVSRDNKFARMASVIVAMLAGSSFVDYPLRTPLMACLFAIVAIWMGPAHIFRKVANFEASDGNAPNKS